MNRYHLGLAFSLSICLTGCSPHLNLNAPPGARPPNEHELFYTTIAANFGDSNTCEMISPRAFEEEGPDLGTTEWRVFVQRSACYFYAALKTKNAKLCDSVEQIVTIPENKSEISRSECLEILQQNYQYGYEPSPNYYSLAGFMGEMGYGEEDFYAAEYAENATNNSVYRFYETIRKTDSFDAQVRSLVSYDEVNSKDRLRPANEDEMLTQMFAVENSLPDFCAKVSPNAYVEGPFGLRWYPQIPERVALRNACLYAVAQNTHRSDLCATIGKVETNPVGMSSMTPDGCEMQLKIQAKDKSWQGYYPPVYFQTMSPFLDVLRRFGYDKPFLNSDKQVDWHHFYRYLMFEAPPEQTQEFLKHVEALPSFAD